MAGQPRRSSEPAEQQPPLPPAERPIPGGAMGAGPLGPGAYMYSEALTRANAPCPKFSRSERFKDPMLSHSTPAAGGATCSELEAEPVPDWGPRQGSRPAEFCKVGGRIVRPLRHPRLKLGRSASSSSGLDLSATGSSGGAGPPPRCWWPPPREGGRLSLAGGSESEVAPEGELPRRSPRCFPPGNHPRGRRGFQASAATLSAAAAREDTLDFELLGTQAMPEGIASGNHLQGRRGSQAATAGEDNPGFQLHGAQVTASRRHLIM